MLFKLHSSALLVGATLATLMGSPMAPATAADADNTSRSAGSMLVPSAASITGYFAVVEGNGSFVRGKGVVSAKRLSTGTYEVIFKAPITRCGFTGTLGVTGFVGVADPGEITVQGRFGTNNGVFVSTQASSGVRADRPFTVVVTC